MNVNKFSNTYKVKWADLDTNGHLRFSVYLDFAFDTQISVMTKHGYPQEKFVALNIGLIILKTEARYYREVTLDESLTDSIILIGISQDGARWKTKHDIVKNDGELVATLKLFGTWIDTNTRQAIAPPSDLRRILELLPRAENFEELRTFIRMR